MAEPVVTAIVSTFAGARFLPGCLDDLLAQTLGDRLEILVIDAASPEDEGAIVRARQGAHPNLRYVRTSTRINTSQAFNRAIGLARGRYLTTANVDDRHHPEFCARLAAVLDALPDVGLVWADSLITTRAGETFAHHTADRRYAWPDWTLPAGLSCCLFGAQPMWRKSAHARAGQWDEALVRANDHDMFLRIAWRCGAVHVREPLGLFLARPDSMSGSAHRAETLREALLVMRRYRTAIPLDDLFPALRRDDSAAAFAAAWFELGNLCALGPYTDAELALACYRRAVDRAPDDAAVRAAFANNAACILAAAESPDAGLRALRAAPSGAEAARNARTFAACRDAGTKPRLTDLAFVELRHPIVTDSRRARGIEFADDGVLRWSAEREQRPWDVFDGPNGVPWPPPAHDAPRARSRAAVLLPRPAVPQHVLLVMYGWNDSGGGTLLPRRLARELVARGHRVSVFCAAAQRGGALGEYAVRELHEDGAQVFALYNRPTLFLDLAAPEREVDDPAVRAVFAGLLDRLAPDVVHFYNLHNLGMSLAGECRARGLPVVFSSNNYWPICPRLYLIDEHLQRCSGGSADGRKCAACVGDPASAPAHAARRAAANDLLTDGIDVHLAVSTRVRELFVHNGADPARTRVLLQQPPAADALWQATGSRRAIVDRLDRPLRAAFVGSILPHKGVHVLARALQLLPPGSVHCVALGDVHPDYRAVLQRIDAGKALALTGPYRQEDLPRLLALVDVVVVPSVWDDCAPLVVAEALAARAPVVGSRIGGIPDFVRDGENGLLFAPGDATDLARCLRAFADDPGLLGRLQRGIAPPPGFGGYVDAVRAVYAEVAARAAVAAGA